MTEIGFQYAVAALSKKRAELSGEIGQLSLQLRDRRRDMRKVDDMLRLLSPGMDPIKIPPKKAIKYLNIFRQGELGRLIINVLRAENRHMTNLEITGVIFDRGGFDERLWTAVRRRVRGNLAYLEKLGRVTKAGAGPGAQWSGTLGRRGR